MEVMHKMAKTVKLTRITVDGHMVRLLINRFTSLIDKHCKGFVEVIDATESAIVFIFWADDVGRDRITNKMNDYNLDVKVDIID